MPAGRIITFYSYKGGSGRTMALANVAFILAANGYRVLAVDWDLESPGLHRYFHPFMVDKELRDTEGLIEMLQRYCTATTAPEAPDDWFAETIRLSAAAVSLGWSFPDDGTLDLLPAGKQDQRYPTKVSKFDWDNFWDRLNGRGFIAALTDAMRQEYDYVLVDSRTGLSDTAGICTVMLPDTVVNCFALSTQAVDGATATARSIIRQDDRIRILPLPGRVEAGEQAKLQIGREYAQRKFRPYTDAATVDTDEYWRRVEVPYKPYYAYEEILAVFGDRPRTANSPLASFQALAGELAGGELAEPKIAEKERQTTLAKFERTAGSAPLRILVRYAGLDRVWAEWLAQQVARAGHECLLAGPGDPRVPLEGVDRAVVLLSRPGLSYAEVEEEWRTEIDRAGLRAGEFVVPARINGPSAPAHVAGAVDLGSLPAEEAGHAMLQALGIRAISGSAATDVGGRIRYPSVRAPHWRVPARRNASFTGRESLIAELRDRLIELDGSGPVSLVGMSGVGKSQIVLEYIHRFAAAYDIVWWVNGDTVDLARSGLEALAGLFDVPGGREGGDRIQAVLRALRERQSPSRWLLVLDNADDPSVFADLLPEGSGDLIVTSRNHAWSRQSSSMEVGVFERPESVALLDRRGAALEDRDASRLADRLGDLPAAIETAGYWLATTARPLDEYLELLDTHVERALSAGQATFEVALASLRAHSPAAARLAEMLAFLAPARIPTAILKTTAISQTLAAHDPSLRDPLLLSSLIQQVGRFGLARSDPASGTVIMHVLTQLVIRDRVDEGEREGLRERVLRALAELDPGDADNAANWQTYDLLRAHLDALRAAESTDPAVRQLIIDVVRYLRLRNLGTSAEALAEQALAAWARAGADDVMNLLLRFQLANAQRDVGRMEQAYQTDKEVLERLTDLLGEDHAYTLMVAGSYAQDLRERGEWAEARRREEKTYGLIPGVLGEDHPRTLMAANNYALTLRLAGRYDEAAAIDQQAFEKRRRLLGDHHPFTFSSADSYGMDQRDLGDLDGSRTTLEALWRSCERVLGEDHPTTLRTMRNLATTLRWLDDAARAAELLDIALSRYERTLGRIHQHTLGCRVEQANAASDLGRHAAARRIVEQAEAGYRDLFADDHPFRLVALNNLGVFTRRAGEPEEGRRIAGQAAAGFATVLGEQHTITALSWVNRANAAAACDDLDEARLLDDRAYEVLRANLRAENIAAIGSTINVAVGRIQAGDHDESDLDRAVAWAARTLGPKHSIVLRGEQRKRIDLPIEPFIM